MVLHLLAVCGGDRLYDGRDDVAHESGSPEEHDLQELEHRSHSSDDSSRQDGFG